jgi:hypothetical protein
MACPAGLPRLSGDREAFALRCLGPGEIRLKAIGQDYCLYLNPSDQTEWLTPSKALTSSPLPAECLKIDWT